jgi:arylsulfatase A-like enzyme
VRTPSLDQLAQGGCRFTNYFSVAALCSPSRGGMMTGRYPQSNGMLGLCHGLHDWRLNDGERHLSRLLHDAGYYTALLGHQHETTDIDRQLCFDEHALHWEDHARGLHTTCDTVAEGVAEFFTGRAAKRAPFFLQVGFFETHRPFDFGGARPDESHGVELPAYIKDNAAGREEFTAFQGNIRKMDAAVGRILAALADAGLHEETLVIYSVDHGIPFPRAKTTLYDAGIAISLIMRWPGRISSGTTCDWLLSNVDLVATILELTGGEAPANLEGTSFAGGLDGEGGPTRGRIYAEHHMAGGECRCVRTDSHKLIRNFCLMPRFPVPVDVRGPVRAGRRPYVELYDLREDPLETCNLAGKPAFTEVQNELDGLLLDWMENVEDPLLSGPVETPYYREARRQVENARRRGPMLP